MNVVVVRRYVRPPDPSEQLEEEEEDEEQYRSQSNGISDGNHDDESSLWDLTVGA